MLYGLYAYLTQALKAAFRIWYQCKTKSIKKLNISKCDFGEHPKALLSKCGVQGKI